MEAILDNIVKIAALMVLLVGSYLAKRLDSYLKARLDQEEAEKLDKLVGELVSAAEQLYKAFDDDGSVRLNYVKGMLIAEGYELTESIMAQIESKVYALNMEANK